MDSFAGCYPQSKSWLFTISSVAVASCYSLSVVTSTLKEAGLWNRGYYRQGCLCGKATTLRGGPVAEATNLPWCVSLQIALFLWCLHWRRQGLGFPLWLLGLVDGVWVAALLKASYECFVYILHVVFKGANCIVEHMICCVVDRCKCYIIGLTDKLYSCRKILTSQYKCEDIVLITLYCTVIMSSCSKLFLAVVSGGTPAFGCSHFLILFRWPFDSHSFATVYYFTAWALLLAMLPHSWVELGNSKHLVGSKRYSAYLITVHSDCANFYSACFLQRCCVLTRQRNSSVILKHSVTTASLNTDFRAAFVRVLSVAMIIAVLVSQFSPC